MRQDFDVAPGAPRESNGRKPECALETSPARMPALKQFNDAYNMLQGWPPQASFEVCQRAFECLDAMGMARLGWRDRQQGEWRWSVSGAATVGINIPQPMHERDNNAEDTNIEEGVQLRRELQR